MRLRRRKTVPASAETPRRRRRPSNKAATKQTRLSLTESPLYKVVDTSDDDLNRSSEEVPTMTRTPMPRCRARKRVEDTSDDDLNRSSEEVPMMTRRPMPRCRARKKVEDTSDDDFNCSSEEVPMMTRRPMPRCRARKRAVAVDDGETDLTFKTPFRRPVHREQVLSEMDPVSPHNSMARNIYSPIVCFLTPSKENFKCTSDSMLMSPEQGVFGYGSIDLLVGDEDDIFNPFTFIKNLPSRSQYSQPRLRDIPPKTRSTPEPTLVVDLEETLMFSSLNVMDNPEYTFKAAFQDHQYKVYMILRPHVKEFLQSMAKVYELFVYTCAKRDYAEKILDVLDPQRKLFRHRLYQEDCACVLGHYIKDLSLLGRDLAKTVVLDNAPHTYPYHLMNTIPVKSWSGESEDRELQKLIPYMEKLSAAEDFREVLKKRKDHFHRLLSEA